MPLKPIFDKSPLMAMSTQPLRAGMVRVDSDKLREIYESICHNERPAALEGTFRLACLVTAQPLEEPVTACIRKALAAQLEDGSFAMPLTDAIAVLRAGWALYEYEARKTLLEPCSRWCAWAARNWETILEDDALWASPADLLELLLDLYRVTGKPALLALCERISAQTMAWSSVLNTISVQRPTSRSVTREELQNGLYGGSDREGYYPRFFRTSHPESLADGARASMARGWLSGSATEMNAAKTGWERLSRHHGAVCGGLTADELLEGASPASPVSTAALGAWAEALCSAAMSHDNAWAWDAAERIVLNGLPVCFSNGQVLPFQRVNTLGGDVKEEECFFVQEDHADRATNRLARGWAALYASAVTACPDGMSVNMFLPGRYAVPVGNGMLILSIQMADGRCTITMHCKQEQKAELRLRLPSWSRNIEVAVNGAMSDAGRECRSGVMTIDRVWHDGDNVSIMMAETLRVMDGYHQGHYVMNGAILMAMPADYDNWAVSFVGASMEDDGVYAVLDRAKEWKLKGHDPADIPVLPAASGAETFKVRLVPYASVDARIALFPGRSNG